MRGGAGRWTPNIDINEIHDTILEIPGEIISEDLIRGRTTLGNWFLKILLRYEHRKTEVRACSTWKGQIQMDEAVFSFKMRASRLICTIYTGFISAQVSGVP